VKYFIQVIQWSPGIIFKTALVKVETVFIFMDDKYFLQLYLSHDNIKTVDIGAFKCQ